MSGQAISPGFDQDLANRLERIRESGLYRELREVDSPQSPRVILGGRSLLNFSSNDYLGLANHPLLREAAIKAVERYGAGAGASRLICGSLAPHHSLDAALAAFKNTAAALSFSSGYAAALGAICSLMTRGDIIILDKLVHACIVDAARLSGATVRVFAHNDLDRLERLLKWAASKRLCAADHPGSVAQGKGRVLVITETVFSMDGDLAPLREIVSLKDRYGAWLMIDEAHATGLLGPNRRGLAEEFDLGDQIEIQMGTLGKALGSAGGFICGSRLLIDFLINRARSFIFSTAPVPAASAAATAALGIVDSGEGSTRAKALRQRVQEVDCESSLHALGSVVCSSPGPRSAIIPVLLGEEYRAVAVANALRERGFLIPAIRYPTVARGHARLRITLTANHSAAETQALTHALKEVLHAPDVPHSHRSQP